MGWNSYNKFGGNVTETQVKAIADAFVSQGLRTVGYEYIVVDYCWSQPSRDASGQMVPVASKFPAGMKALGDYVHGLGLKFGMYQSPTKVTCCSEPGSYQHEQSDAQQFASWGVDYIKYDWCGVQSHENGTVTAADVMARYTTMRDAIKATGRPIVYAVCEKGQGAKVQPATWSEPVGHLWRIGNDIAANWARVLTSFDGDLSLAQYARPGGWNDPDMLEVGNGSLTDAESRAHFSLWSIVAAPLMLGNDPSTMTASVKTIVTNVEVIAVDQDALGKQGQRVAVSGQAEVWSKPMQDGSVAVVMFNRGAASATISVDWSAIGISGSSRVRDLWQHSSLGSFATAYSATVPSHDVAMIRVYPPGISDDAGVGSADSGRDGAGNSDGPGGDAAGLNASGDSGSTAGSDAAASRAADGSDATADGVVGAAEGGFADEGGIVGGGVAGAAASPATSNRPGGCACNLTERHNAADDTAGLMVAALALLAYRRRRTTPMSPTTGGTCISGPRRKHDLRAPPSRGHCARATAAKSAPRTSSAFHRRPSGAR